MRPRRAARPAAPRRASAPGRTSAPWRSAQSWTVARARPSSRRGCTTRAMRSKRLAFTLRVRGRIACRARSCASPSTPGPPDLPADLARPRIAGGAGAELLELTSADGTALLGRAGASRRRADAAARLVDPAGRARPLPVLHRARRALRRRPATTRSRSTTSAARPASAPRGEDFEYMTARRRDQRSGSTRSRPTLAAALAALRERTGADERRGPSASASAAPSTFLAADERTTSTSSAFDRLLRRAEPRAHGGDSGSPMPLDARRRCAARCSGCSAAPTQGIPPEQVDAVRPAPRRGRASTHEIVVYPGAPHSFFDRRFEEHADACADAWRRVLAFL